MSTTRAARSERFNRLGPWYLVGAAVGAVIVYVALRDHHLTREDLVLFVAIIPSIVVHEVSHGWVAKAFGDNTAKQAGRLTLNPLRHVDPIGTILLPIFLIVIPPHQPFGWAKPVPVAVNKLRHPRNESVIVSLAGPAVNIVFALAGGYALRFVTHNISPPGGLDNWPIWEEFLYLFGYVNVLLATFNLIPIPPLDGSAVVERLLPASMLSGYYRLRSFSIFLVLFFVFFAPGVLDTIFDHALSIWGHIVFS